MLRNNNEAFSLNQESVDLNSYLYAEKIYLSKIAEVLGLKDEANIYAGEADILKGKIQDNFYDKKSGYFFDISIDKKKYIPVYGPEGWIPLWAMAVSQAQAESVEKIIFDSDKFKTTVPFPTVSADNPKLDVKGYWRGPVWLDQAYFGIVGLRNYGFVRDARRLTERTFKNLEGYIKSDKPIRENYNPLTGEGLKANNFSWSAAHLLLMWFGK
jgi:putative isomerase